MENNSKLLLSGKFDFDPEEILDKLLLFDLKKKTRKDKKHLNGKCFNFDESLYSAQIEGAGFNGDNSFL